MIAGCDHPGGIRELVISNPPVNALATSVRRALRDAVHAAEADPSIKALVIRGAGKCFSGGADIKECGSPPVEPVLTDVISFIEAGRKPVVAALHGAVLGGGLELALGCHYRIAARGATLGLPEVKLGLMPGAGGAQRLPRLVGIRAALDMIVSAEPISADRAADIGLVDHVVDDDRLQAEAIAYACSLAEPRRTSERPLNPDEEAIAAFISTLPRRLLSLDAVKACIDAVRRACEMPISQALAVDRAKFLKLAASEQSKALRHVFFAERAAARIDGIPNDVAPRSIGAVGVIGAGTMGAGIAINFLSAGLPVILVDSSDDALDLGRRKIEEIIARSLAKGRLTAEQASRAAAMLVTTRDLASLTDCDLVVEAVYENLELKKQLFAQLDVLLRPGAILASNTSYLSIDALAGVTKRARDVLGLHFFSPAHVMPLVEIVRGDETDFDVLVSAREIAKRIGKIPVFARVCHGFIGNRMLAQRQQNALALVLEGAAPQHIDAIHQSFGMPMGPFRMTDLAGVDIGWHRDVNRADTLKEALCAAGRLGEKVGAGFYDYDDQRRPRNSPVVEEIIAQFRSRAGIIPRSIDDEEIIVRTIYTMVNEGAKILEEGIAQRASDIDVVWIRGYGWPRHTGGPMFWADQIGAGAIVEGLHRHRERLGAEFSIAPSLEARARLEAPVSPAPERQSGQAGELP